MSWIAVAVAAVGVGTAVYSDEQQKKAANKQADALKEAQAQDERDRIQAEVGAQNAANAQLAATKKRRRDSALALGNTGGTPDALGGSAVLGAGSAPTVTSTSALSKGAA